jgi:hypothetical protein
MKRFSKSILRAVAIDGGVGLENPTRIIDLLEEFSDKTHQLQLIQYTSGGLMGAVLLAVLSGGSIGLLGASMALIAGALGASMKHGLSAEDSRELALLHKHRSLLHALAEIDHTHGTEKTLTRYEELIASYSQFEDCFYFGQSRIGAAEITGLIEQAIANNATSIQATIPAAATQTHPAIAPTRFSLSELTKCPPLNQSPALPPTAAAPTVGAANAVSVDGQLPSPQWDEDVPLETISPEQGTTPTLQQWDEDVQPDDLPTLRKALRHPAVLIFGESGAGKSTLAEWDIGERIKEGHQVEVWDPHAAYGQWEGLPVYGQGLDYAGCDRRIVAFINLVKARYVQRSQNPNFNPRPLSVLVEEFTKWDGKCPHAGELLAIALSDVRKINVFILFVAHDRTLTSLGGAKGIASARDKGLMEIELNAVQDPKTDALVSAQTGRIYYPGRKNAPVEIVLPNLKPPSPPAASTTTDVRYQLEWMLEPRSTHPTPSMSPLPKDAEALYRWAAKQGKPIRERDVLAAKLKGLEGYSADQIRDLFRVLEAQGYGTTKPAGSGLEFIAG